MENDWKKVERKAHNFEEDSVLEGVYLGKVESQFDNDNHLFKVDDDEVLVFGKTALNTKLSAVKFGMTLKVVYKGKVKSKKGREYDDFDVFYKEEGD